MKQLKGFILAKTSDASIAEDIFQETYRCLLEAEQRTLIKNAHAYATTIAKNLIRAHLQNRHRFTEYQDDRESDAPLPDKVMEGREAYRHFCNAVMQLPELRRAVFIQRKLDNRSSREVADRYGLSVNTIDKHVSRALSFLRKEIDQ